MCYYAKRWCLVPEHDRVAAVGTCEGLRHGPQAGFFPRLRVVPCRVRQVRRTNDRRRLQFLYHICCGRGVC